MDEKSMKSELSEDKLFSQYLAGRDPLSSAYGQGKFIEPSPEIDDVILAAAKRGVIAKPRPVRRPLKFATRAWVLPFSIAAVLVVALSVTLRMFDDEKVSNLNEVARPIPIPETSHNASVAAEVMSRTE